MTMIIKVDREFDRVVSLESLDRVCFGIPEETFQECQNLKDETLIVRRISLYDEWNTTYRSRDVSFFRHVDEQPVMALPKP